MTTRAAMNLPGIYRGDDYNVVFGMYGQGGGLIGDAGEGQGAILIDGSDQITLPAGVNIRHPGRAPRGFIDVLFNTDVGTQLTLLTGQGITDGTTITAVALDGRSATMSAPATASRISDAACVVRAKDITPYEVSADVRQTEDGDLLYALPIVDDRFDAGVIWVRIYSKAHAVNLGLPITGGGAVLVTDAITAAGIYDVQMIESATGVTTTPILGQIPFVKDRTHQ